MSSPFLKGTADHETIISPVSAATDTVGVHAGVQRELYRGGVDDTDDVS